jgi:3-deoxy-manno-octulosonate cytidylyltransferase (CMP-KDO synthetase)
MKIIGIIPARYASTRFPGKPLVDIQGKPMIQRVYEQAKKSKILLDVIVATDDERIENVVKSFGGKVVMTASHHQSGTDRCQQVAEKIIADAYINIQGDEPFIHPEQIDLLANLMQQQTENFFLCTLIKKIEDEKLLHNPNIIKVVINNKNEALYFSRSAIPFKRNEKSNNIFYKHIGMYGYSKLALELVSKLPTSLLEQTEQLEQLRWLEHGLKIFIAETDLESHSVDVPDDLKKF